MYSTTQPGKPTATHGLAPKLESHKPCTARRSLTGVKCLPAKTRLL